MEIGSCTAVIYKIQTLLDGGARLTLDISAKDAEIITKLMERKLKNQPLVQIGVIGIETN